MTRAYMCVTFYCYYLEKYVAVWYLENIVVCDIWEEFVAIFHN